VASNVVATPTAGKVFLAWVVTRNTAQTVDSVTGWGLTWTAIPGATAEHGGVIRGTAFVGLGTLDTGEDPPTATVTGGNDIVMDVFDVDGDTSSASAAVVEVVSGASSGTNPINLLLTGAPVTSYQVVFGAKGTSNLGHTPEPGWTEVVERVGGTGITINTVAVGRVVGDLSYALHWGAETGRGVGVLMELPEASGVVTSAYDDLILSHADLVAYYPLASNATDYEGSADGTATSVTFGADPVINSDETGDVSASFNGSSSKVEMTVPNLGTAWTIELWTDPFGDSGDVNEGLVVRDSLPLYIYRNIAGNLVATWSGAPSSLGAPPLGPGAHHVVLTHDGTTARLYLNGTLYQAMTSTAPNLTSAAWRLGSLQASAGYYPALMQKVAFYDAALSASEVTEHYLEGSADTYASTINAIAPSVEVEAEATSVNVASVAAVHSLPQVSGEMEAAESTLTAVGKEVSFEWDVYGAVGKSLELPWQVSVGASFEYDEAGIGYDDSNVTYGGTTVVTAVGKSVELEWDTYASAAKSLELEWNVAAPVGKSLAVRWSTEVVVDPEPVVRYAIDWDGGGFEILPITADISFTWTRTAGPDLEGQSPSSATLVLHNQDRRYTDTNPDSDLYERLRPNSRFMAWVDYDGSLKGLWSGYLADMSVSPEVPTAELVFDDLLHRLSEIDVDVTPVAGMSYGAFRLAVLQAAGVPSNEIDLDIENDILLDTGDWGSGKALTILEQINHATGTRHFIRPGYFGGTWQQYVTVNRTHKLTQAAPDIEINDRQHILNPSGNWRTAWNTVINRQTVTFNPEVEYAADEELIWTAPHLPIFVPNNGTTDVWASNIGPLADLRTVVFGSGLTFQSGTRYADSVRVTVSAGSSGGFITSLDIYGRPGTRQGNTSVTDSDTASITAYGLHEGPSRHAIGSSGALAAGIADHLVWRYSEPRKQPDARLAVPNQEMVGRDLFDLVGFTVAELLVEGRRMEILGESGEYRRGLLQIGWQLQDTPEQEPSDWFILDVSTLDSNAQLSY
jgi:hypothetical protein